MTMTEKDLEKDLEKDPEKDLEKDGKEEESNKDERERNNWPTMPQGRAAKLLKFPQKERNLRAEGWFATEIKRRWKECSKLKQKSASTKIRDDVLSPPGQRSHGLDSQKVEDLRREGEECGRGEKKLEWLLETKLEKELAQR